MVSHVTDDGEKVVQAVYAALADRDRVRLRVLLHPYLHWTGADGVTVRGRTKVLARLDELGQPPELPAAVELRDGQIYRWQTG
jgi:hypothetical protein